MAMWSTSIFGCCNDPGICCLTCFCPCITMGRMIEILDRGETSCGLGGFVYWALGMLGVPCLYSCHYRTKLRKLYSLEKSLCGDCLVHCFCELCAICQEYRELKNHGVDPSLGWQGNADKLNRSAVTNPPSVALGMSR